jgi:DNA-binding MarR family transcriptional regulator
VLFVLLQEAYFIKQRDTLNAADELRILLQEFFRQFGVLRESSTPCGKKLSLSHAHALMILLEAERLGSETNQQSLGASLGIDKSNVARLCQRMFRAGHVNQEKGVDDGRARFVSLTDRGRKLAKEVEKGSKDRFRRLFSGLSDDEVAKVLTGLNILCRSMERFHDDKS